MKKQIGILGATGYTGVELLKLLERHPSLEVSWLTSERHAGKSLHEIFPELRGIVRELTFIKSAEAVEKSVDGIFSCLPHQTAAEGLALFIDKTESKIVDLSADFRMKDVKIYEKYYCTHPRPELLNESVYGLSEWNAKDIATKRIIGNPGCYPTSILAPLKPLVEKGWIDVTSIIADSKSGVSGAGKSPNETTHFCNSHENFYAYKVADEHRHISEINEQLTLAGGKQADVIFTPHLLPIIRGILSTIYANLTTDLTQIELVECLREAYKDSPFVDVLENGFPQLNWVQNNNRCIFGLKVLANKKIIIVSVIDNLLKGASGQALQNMNIALGLDQAEGLV